MNEIWSQAHAQTDGLVDQFGRKATDLRVSITDRCDLRCTYCMPAEGLNWQTREEILTAGEIHQLASAFVKVGVTSIRITGGEPLVRRDVTDIIGQLSALDIDDLSMTTNGTQLPRFAEPLKDAGLQRINVSIDSLRPERFAAITRRDALTKVLDGIQAANNAGISPIKLNCVLQRSVNDDEIVDFAQFARETGYEIRFIEPMPLDGERAWQPSRVVPAAEIIDRINQHFQLISDSPFNASQPATVYKFADGAQGRIGVIGSVSKPFCSTCNRLRLTADGQLRTCLFAHDETDLKTPLRNGANQEELIDLIAKATWSKQSGHAIGNVDFLPPKRSMSEIGG